MSMREPGEEAGGLSERELQADEGAAIRQFDVPAPSFARPAHLSREIALYVRDLVMSGQLREKQQLNIDQLARDWGISTTPVREALLALKGEGFVEFEPRKGFRVAPLSRRDVEDLFLVQSNIAGELASRAALYATEAELQQIESLQQEMYRRAKRKATEDVEALNFQFHRVINHSAHSPKLSWLLGVVVNYMPRRFYSTIAGWPAASLRDHDAIILGLTKRDEKSARKAMSSHIEHAGTLLIAHLEESGFWTTRGEPERGLEQ